MARPYRNADTQAFNLPAVGRPGPGHCGYIGKSFLGEQDSPDAPPYERTMLRTWHWLDEEQGLLAQVNVTDCSQMGKHVLPGYLPREGEPAHYQKLFTWPWTDISPSRLQDIVRIRSADHAPETFVREHPRSMGAYVLGFGSEAGFNGFLGLPDAPDKQQLPEGAAPPASRPWTLEVFIKDGLDGRWAAMPSYSTESGELDFWLFINEAVDETDPATPCVLEQLRPRVPHSRGKLPSDAASWLPAGTPGKATLVFVGEGGELMIEKGLPAQWTAPDPDSPPNHTLVRMPDESYMLVPANIFRTNGPSVFEFGCRQHTPGSRGFRRLVMLYDAGGVFVEARYEDYP